MPVVPRAFYNEIDPFAAHLLRRLIDEGVIAPGVVSEKSIKEITADDLRGFTQVHFFAGGGLWSVAARQAGWADGRPIWTASCPCQPFSRAGQGRGADDPRHLWPDVDRLVHECRAAGFGPSVLVGEQVAGAAGYHWFDGVRTDLAQQGYGARVVDIPACAVDAPHIRQRLYWVALADGAGSGRDAAALAGICGEAQGERSRDGESERLHGVQRDMADAGCIAGRPGPGDANHGAFDANLYGAGSMAEPAGDGREQGEPRASVTRYGCEPSTAHGGINGAMAYSDRGGREGRSFEPGREALERNAVEGHDEGSAVVHASSAMWQGQSDAERIEARPARRPDAERADRRDSGRNGSFWADAEWLICHDGKARRTQPGLRLLVDGLPRRVDLWRVAGNAIVVAEAREVIAALMDVIDGGYAAPRVEPFPRDLFERIA